MFVWFHGRFKKNEGLTVLWWRTSWCKTLRSEHVLVLIVRTGTTGDHSNINMCKSFACDILNLALNKFKLKKIITYSQNIIYDRKNDIIFISHTQILGCLKRYKISRILLAFFQSSLRLWMTPLEVISKLEAQVSIKCGAYQGDVLSPLN